MKKIKWLCSLACLVTLCYIIAGCGGGGGGGAGGDVGVTLTLGADTSAVVPGGAEARNVATRAVTLTAPLAQGSSVTIYNYATGATIATGILDASGYCNLSVPPGITALVVITGTRGGKSYRLSIIIPQTPTANATYVCNPATTVAAECVAQKHPLGTTALDQDTWDNVLNAAETYVQDHASDDYSIGGGLIGGSAFGASDSINTAKVTSVLVAVPDTIDSKLVAAKNAVQQIKGAGVPLEAMLNDEWPDIQGIFTQTVVDKYQAFIERASILIIPAISERLVYQTNQVSVFDLTMGQGYKVVGTNDVLTITDDNTHDIAGQITVKRTTGAGTYTLTAKKLSASNWEIKQTFSGDSAQQYVANLPSVDLGANPTISGSFSFKDSELTTPLTFSGTVSAIGADPEHYTKVTLSGTLTSAELESSGTFEAQFPSSLPQGAPSDKRTYDYPTKVSMTNGNIRAKGTGKTITLTGNITVNLTPLTHSGKLEPTPTSFQMEGTYNNTHTGLSFDGTMSATWSNPGSAVTPTNAVGTLTMNGELTRTGHPSYGASLSFQLSGGTISSTINLTAGSTTLTGTGTATLNADGEVQTASMTLTNQAGVQFNLARSVSGTISGSVKVSGEEQATITKENSLLRINFKDGTFESFPI